MDGLTSPGYAVYWITDWSANIPTAVSTDLVHWRRVPDALSEPALVGAGRPPPARWGTPDGVSTLTWGPTVRRVAGG